MMRLIGSLIFVIVSAGCSTVDTWNNEQMNLELESCECSKREAFEKLKMKSIVPTYAGKHSVVVGKKAYSIDSFRKTMNEISPDSGRRLTELEGSYQIADSVYYGGIAASGFAFFVAPYLVYPLFFSYSGAAIGIGVASESGRQALVESYNKDLKNHIDQKSAENRCTERTVASL